MKQLLIIVLTFLLSTNSWASPWAVPFSFNASSGPPPDGCAGGGQLCYLRSGTGLCDADLNGIILAAAGSSVDTILIDSAAAANFSRDEDVNIPAGTWTVNFDLTVPLGGGPQNTVRVRVKIWEDAICFGFPVIQCTVDVNVNKGTTEEYTATITGCPELVLGDDDFYQITFKDQNGNQSKTLRFNNAASTDADTRFTTP